MRYIIALIQVFFLALFVFLITNGKMVVWLGLFAVSLIAALIFGRVYCGYVCPMNTLMIPTEWLSKKLKLQRNETPMWLQSGKYTWLALGISLTAMLLWKNIWQINLPVLLMWLGVAILVTLRYEPYVFHNLICPFAGLHKVFGSRARLSKKVDKQACIGCKLCEETCPSKAITIMTENKKAIINKSMCHQCANCQQICPVGAIHYRIQK